MKDRLLALAASRVTADGVLLIDSREHRTQAPNREAARERLVELIAQASRTPRRRKSTRPRRAARARRLKAKELRGKVKALRRRDPEQSTTQINIVLNWFEDVKRLVPTK